MNDSPQFLTSSLALQKTNGQMSEVMVDPMYTLDFEETQRA